MPKDPLRQILALVPFAIPAIERLVEADNSQLGRTQLLALVPLAQRLPLLARSRRCRDWTTPWTWTNRWCKGDQLPQWLAAGLRIARQPTA